MFKGDGAHTTDVVSEPFYHGLSVEGSGFYPLFSRESPVLVRLGEHHMQYPYCKKTRPHPQSALQLMWDDSVSGKSCNSLSFSARCWH